MHPGTTMASVRMALKNRCQNQVTDEGGRMSSDPRPHDVAPGGDGEPPVPLGLTVVVAQLDVSDAEDVLRSLAGRLLDAGAVTVDFPEALRAREQRYPTGLPTPIPTAIPHADPEHVLVPGLAIATLARPVAFGEMGGTGGTVDARLVAMPLLTDARAHLAALQSLMGLLRDEAAVQDLLGATDEDELRERTMTHLSGGAVGPGEAADGNAADVGAADGTTTDTSKGHEA